MCRNKRKKCLYWISFIFIIFSTIIQIANVIIYKIIKNNFFDSSFHEISKINKNYSINYILDLILLINDCILLTINLLIIIFYKNDKLETIEGVIDNESDINVIEKRKILNDNEKLKKENEKIKMKGDEINEKCNRLESEQKKIIQNNEEEKKELENKMSNLKMI